MGNAEQDDFYIRNAAMAFALDIARLNCAGSAETVVADAEKIRDFLAGEKKEG